LTVVGLTQVGSGVAAAGADALVAPVQPVAVAEILRNYVERLGK
jgi:hypothetical protein